MLNTDSRWLSLGRHTYETLGKKEAYPPQAIKISLRQIAPTILAGSALLYQQGAKDAHGNTSRYDWLRSLLEAGVGSWVIQNTMGLFPLLGIALGSYEAGKQEVEADKLKALSTTLVTMLLGWTGVKIMQGYSDSALDEDAKGLYETLTPRDLEARHHLRAWTNNLPDTIIDETGALLVDESGEAIVHPLKPAIHDLTERLNHLFSEEGPHRGMPTTEALRANQSAISTLQQTILSSVDEMGETLLEELSDPVKGVVDNVFSRIRHLQSPLRRLNNTLAPAFGYIIVGMVLSTPITSWLNRWIDKRAPKKPVLLDGTGFNRLSNQFASSADTTISPSLQPPSYYPYY